MLKKLCALALAALMLLSLAACGKKEDPAQQWQQLTQDAEAPDEATFVAQAAGTLELFADAQIQISYDTTGKVLAVVGRNELGVKIDAAYNDFADKNCTKVVRELVDLIIANKDAKLQNFVLVRQAPGSAMPANNFLDAVEKNGSGNKKKIPVVTVAAEDCDSDGCFDRDTALKLLKLAIPATAGMNLVCAEAPSALVYTVLATDSNKVTTHYLVDALSGHVSVGTADDTQEEQVELTDIDETEPIPDEDILDIPPDDGTLDGTDGGVDQGSVDFS